MGTTPIDEAISEAEATLSAESEHQIGHIMVEINYNLATGGPVGMVLMPEAEIPLLREACRRLGLVVFDSGLSL